MTLRLIVNSDDYGRCAAVSRGVREAHARGIVTSTTCMMNFPTVEEDIALACQETPELGMGVHLVLTSGSPLLPPDEVPSLVSSDGAFYKLAPFVARLDQINAGEAKSEWRAQIEKFIQASGRSPTHLDSHHHASYCTDDLFRTMLELAREYGCAIRNATVQVDGALNGLPLETHTSVRQFAPRLLDEFQPRAPHVFYPSFYDDLATREEILRIFQALPDEGDFELMCHPGYVDQVLLDGSIYALQREGELGVLTDETVKEALQGRGIQLITFADL